MLTEFIEKGFCASSLVDTSLNSGSPIQMLNKCYSHGIDMEIKPIRTETDYEAALKEVEQLWGAELGTPDGDRFEVLFTLVEAYEDRHYAILPPDPVDAIQYYMESRGLDRRDLEQYIGPSGRVSEVLSRKRPLTLAMIRKLHAGLGIPAQVLIRNSLRD